MKTYPYQDGDRLIQLVEKLECDKLQDQLYRICKEGFGNDDTIGLEPADDYVLRKLHELNAANAELLERLAEARESHLAASARDVQTIQRQGVLLERLAGALRAINSLEGDELIPSDNVWSDASVAAFHESITALSAYESANLEPVANPIDEAVKRMEAVSDEELNKVHWNGDGCVNSYAANNRVRARLIQAAKGEQL